jgi:hypothetical protein
MSLNLVTPPLFTFPPNWAEPPELRLRAITEIWPAKTGREERVARIAIPALSVTYSLLTDVGQASSLPQAVAAAFSRFLRDHLGQSLAVPLWSEAMMISSVSGGNTVHLYNPCSQRLFSAGRPCLLVASAFLRGQRGDAVPDCEPIVPATVSSTQIVAVAEPAPFATIAGAFVAGDFIVPLIYTNPVTDNQTAEWLAGFQAQGTVEFIEAFAEAHALPFDAATLLPTYRGLPLFPFLLNFADSVTDDSEIRSETREDDAGQIAAAVYESAARTLPHGSVLLQNRDQIAALLTWFNAVLGRARKTWVASARPNFTLASPVAAQATTITVASTDYATRDSATTQRTVILIRHGARYYCRAITGAVDNEDGTETLTLDYRLPDPLGLTAVISYLYLCRSDLDEIALQMLSQTVASCAVNFHELPLEIADVLLGAPAPCYGAVSDAMLLVGTTCCPTISLDDSLRDGTPGTAYTGTVTASGGASPYTYAVTSGSLPTGLSLAIDGAITGTPTTAGTFDFTITATDAEGCTGSRADYSVAVSCPSITLDDTLPNDIVGTAYTGSVAASGGSSPYSYARTLGTLPDGLSLASTGAITGTPTAGGSFGFTVTATDAHGCTGARAYTVIICPTIALDDTLPDGSDCLTYTGTVTASGGAAPYAYAVTSGALPGGTTLNASTGVISSGSGNPTAGTFDFTITATDANGCTGARADYEVRICACGTPCSNCTGITPAIVLLAGGTNVTRCASDGDFTVAFAFSPGALTQASGCGWRGVIGTITSTHNTERDCSGSADGTPSVTNIIASVTRNSGAYYLALYAGEDASFPFYEHTFPDSGCLAGATMSITITAEALGVNGADVPMSFTVSTDCPV